MSDQLELTKTNYTFDKLATLYSDFFAPAFEVKIDGKDAIKELGCAIPSVSVKTSVQMESGSFNFTVTNGYDWVKRDFLWKSVINVGKEVNIRMGYVDKLKPVFNGIITQISFDYPAEGNPTFSVSGMDYSYTMMKGKNASAANTWLNKSHADAVKEIAGLYGLNTKNVDDTPVEETFGRDGRDDFRLIADWAKEHDYEFFVLGKMLYFRKPPYSDTTAVTTLTYGQNLRSFSSSIDISAQVTKVIARGYNKKEDKPIEATSKPTERVGSNSSSGADLAKALGGGKVHYEYTTISNESRLQEKADEVMRGISMKLVNGNGESIGLPDLMAGRFILLDHVGERFNKQPLYMSSVSHKIDSSSGYLTTFDVRGNAI